MSYMLEKTNNKNENKHKFKSRISLCQIYK